MLLFESVPELSLHACNISYESRSTERPSEPESLQLSKLLGRARKETEEVVRVGENGGMETRFLAACVWHVL